MQLSKLVAGRTLAEWQCLANRIFYDYMRADGRSATVLIATPPSEVSADTLEITWEYYCDCGARYHGGAYLPLVYLDAECADNLFTQFIATAAEQTKLLRRATAESCCKS